MSHQPRVSVGVPVYNGQTYIGQALDSLLEQDYGDFEVIISDNASTDATSDICRDYAQRDSRIRYYRNERNLGAAVNYSATVRKAKGEYFKWLAHDDMCAPSYLRVCVQALEESSSQVVLAYPRTLLIDEAGECVREHVDNLDTRGFAAVDRLALMLSDPACWCHPVLGVIRLQVLRSTRLIEGYCGADQTLLAELALRGEFRKVNEPLFLRRVAQGLSPSLQAHAIPDDLAVWFDIRNQDRVTMLWTRIWWGHMQAIWSAPIQWHEKLACLRLLKTSPYAAHWSRAMVWSEVSRAVREAGARQAILAIRRNRRDCLPHRIWALWDGLKYRRWEWVRLACARPSADTRAALLEFVIQQLKRRHDRLSRELLDEWLGGKSEERCAVAPRAATLREPVMR